MADAHTHLEFEELRKENEELKQRIDDLEELLTKVRTEVTLIKKYEWGTIQDPPTVKPDIC